MNIREWYINEFPSDELGIEINPNLTFDGLARILNNYADVYEYIGVSDSIVRERCFEKLSEVNNTEYSVIYELWLMAA